MTEPAPVAKAPVKSDPINFALATCVSKSFALKFLRKAFVGARIQKIPGVPGADPTIETWQVWATGPKGKQGLVEVTGPRAVLPYACVREAFLKRLNMRVEVIPLKNGVRMTAEEIKPEPTEAPASEAKP
jgi:hypothetical protein